MINNLVITGIPRSGTSYVCALLNDVENTVIVNEPPEALSLLHNRSVHPLTEYYDATRSDILNRVPIQNKIVGGKFIEDTNANDTRNYYTPEVNDAAFIFGSKNTLVYLVCIKKIIRQFQDVGILACIRHPYDTIASWKKVSFPHLRNATPLFLRDYVDSNEGKSIARICTTSELEARYALLWNYLAMRIIDSIDHVTLFKYEEFVRNPARNLSRLYDSLGVGEQKIPEITPSKARKHRDVLSAAEMNYIQQYCRNSADYFGYEL